MFQEVEAPTFQDHQHMKVVRLSALHNGRLYPQEIILLLIYVRGWVKHRALVRPEGICQWKFPMKTTGNRIYDLPACSAVPQPNVPPRDPVIISGTAILFNDSGTYLVRSNEAIQHFPWHRLQVVLHVPKQPDVHNWWIKRSRSLAQVYN